MRTYRQLTQAQRYQIYPGTARQGRCALQRAGHSTSEISAVIEVHKSTVSRELKRNRGQRGYRPQQAQRLALERQRQGTPRITAATWAIVDRLLRQDWSPACTVRRHR